jgi:hypothetical protein
MHIQRLHVEKPIFSVLISIQHILLWSKMHYFARWEG